jgi:hypothetical protein
MCKLMTWGCGCDHILTLNEGSDKIKRERNTVSMIERQVD